MEDYGDYFAWGETVGYNGGKKTFSKSTYKYYMLTTTKDKDGFDIVTEGYTKYIRKSNASKDGYDGFYDDKTILDPEDDAAVANWGGYWRMPTEAEQYELRTKCTWEWKELNGKEGYKVTGPNGNFIFLPKAGIRFDSDFYLVGGSYRSSSHTTDSSSSVVCLCFTKREVYRCNEGRYEGFSVRAVCPY